MNRSIKPFNHKRVKGLDVSDELNKRGLNPIAEIVQELGELHKPQDRITVWLQLLKYCAPQMKTIEVAVDDDQKKNPITPENVKEFWKRAHEAAQEELVIDET